MRAEAIVAEEAEGFRAWQLSLDVVPAIALFGRVPSRSGRASSARAEAASAP